MNVEIDGPAGSVEQFIRRELPLGSLDQMWFRSSSGNWVRHPQVEFVTLPVSPPHPMPGVDLRWQQILVGAPCGVLPVGHRFVSGERVEALLGHIENPDVVTTMRYSAVLRLMAGTWTTLEAFERDGHIDGEWASMMLLGGICETVEFVDAMRIAAADVAGPLADLADG
jgi:hypothetical protein